MAQGTLGWHGAPWGAAGSPRSPEHQVPVLQAEANEVSGFATLAGLLRAQRGVSTLTPTLRGAQRPGALPDGAPPPPLTAPCHSSSPSVLPVRSSSSMVSGASGGLQGEGGLSGCSTPGWGGTQGGRNGPRVQQPSRVQCHDGCGMLGRVQWPQGC